MNSPLISICIPAYKQPEFVRRLLESIQGQNFSDYEIIITDDTPNDSVEHVCKDFLNTLPLRYFYNKIPLGSPANWNAAVAKANGEWIKIMHGDDWFTSSNSLEKFAQAAQKHRNGIIFSAYYNYQEGTGIKKKVGFSWLEQHLLKRSPFYLLKRNYIGPPSTTLLHKDTWQPYNPKLKWIVDFEGYIRFLFYTKGRFYYLESPIICVGIHFGQVTTDCFLIPEVEIPENVLLAKEYDGILFRNFFAFDYFWRLIRNLNINSVEQFESYIPNQQIPAGLTTMIRQANTVPHSLRKIGLLSKLIAFFFWIKS